jgi:hypothetical protein
MSPGSHELEPPERVHVVARDRAGTPGGTDESTTSFRTRSRSQRLWWPSMGPEPAAAKPDEFNPGWEPKRRANAAETTVSCRFLG